MSGILPAWLEQWLGVAPASPGEGTVWSLENTWNWAPWVTLLFLLFVDRLGRVLLFARNHYRRSTGEDAASHHATRADRRRAADDRRDHAVAAPHRVAHRGGRGRRLGQHGNYRPLRRRKAARTGREAHPRGRTRWAEPAEPGQNGVGRQGNEPAELHRPQLPAASCISFPAPRGPNRVRWASCAMPCGASNRAARAAGWAAGCVACSATCAALRRQPSSI